jgi:hypothetical protein
MVWVIRAATPPSRFLVLVYVYREALFNRVLKDVSLRTESRSRTLRFLLSAHED